jgi:putative ABC transport system substrate-binding protein
MLFNRYYLATFFIILFFSCNSPSPTSKPYHIAFLDAFEDETISQAKTGFIKALADSGFSQSKNLEIIYKNAQGSIPTLNQEISYVLDQKVQLIATNTTLPTIAVSQITKSIPIFMMVAPSPQMAGLLNEKGNPPVNLFGVYDNLDYIDTSILLVRQIIPSIQTLGAIFSEGESQSHEAYLHLQAECKKLGIKLLALPVNNSSETHLVVENLLSHHLDAFFALPDNSVFSSFETIVQSCKQARVPIFTSEEGLVKRGALAAFGADIYEWGYQAGQQAAHYLKHDKITGLKPELVKIRRKVYNTTVATEYKIIIPPGVIALGK